jgi:AcrR family transcriptional regulator
MSLLEEQMEERRTRILAAARRLITDGGFEGLTMRQLAETARVSVPTVYNLIGNKYLLLEVLVKQQLAEALAAMAKVPPNLSIVDYLELMPGLTHDVLLANPRYTRALIHVFLTAEDSAPARRELDRGSLEVIAASVRAGQQLGELVSWADPERVASAMYAIYVSALICWASGEIEENELRASTRHGIGLVLLGLTTGDVRARLEEALRARETLARERAPSRRGEGEHGASSRR